MTSKLTRERLVKIKSWREIYGAGSNVMLPAEEAEELACLALAAMDSEPVILYRQVNPANEMKTYWAELDPEEFRHLKQHTDENAEFMTLYRHAQPAPVAPEEMTPEQAYEIGDYHGDPVEVFARGANWMRQHIINSTLAAAPQSPGSEPATVPGKWIPVSEQMPCTAYGVLVATPWPSTIGGYAMKWATHCPWHPDADDNGWIIPGASWTPTHWMPLPAAPHEDEK